MLCLLFPFKYRFIYFFSLVVKNSVLALETLVSYVISFAQVNDLNLFVKFNERMLFFSLEKMENL